MEKYIVINPKFSVIGSRMVDSWKLSLDGQAYKELPDDVIRNWTKN
jgi:hypothetical protein